MKRKTEPRRKTKFARLTPFIISDTINVAETRRMRYENKTKAKNIWYLRAKHVINTRGSLEKRGDGVNSKERQKRASLAFFLSQVRSASWSCNNCECCKVCARAYIAVCFAHMNTHRSMENRDVRRERRRKAEIIRVQWIINVLLNWRNKPPVCRHLIGCCCSIAVSSSCCCTPDFAARFSLSLSFAAFNAYQSLRNIECQIYLRSSVAHCLTTVMWHFFETDTVSHSLMHSHPAHTHVSDSRSIYLHRC